MWPWKRACFCICISTTLLASVTINAVYFNATQWYVRACVRMCACITDKVLFFEGGWTRRSSAGTLAFFGADVGTTAVKIKRFGSSSGGCRIWGCARGDLCLSQRPTNNGSTSDGVSTARSFLMGGWVPTPWIRMSLDSFFDEVPLYLFFAYLCSYHTMIIYLWLRRCLAPKLLCWMNPRISLWQQSKYLPWSVYRIHPCASRRTWRPISTRTKIRLIDQCFSSFSPARYIPTFGQVVWLQQCQNSDHCLKDTAAILLSLNHRVKIKARLDTVPPRAGCVWFVYFLLILPVPEVRLLICTPCIFLGGGGGDLCTFFPWVTQALAPGLQGAGAVTDSGDFQWRLYIDNDCIIWRIQVRLCCGVFQMRDKCIVIVFKTSM